MISGMDYGGIERKARHAKNDSIPGFDDRSQGNRRRYSEIEGLKRAAGMNHDRASEYRVTESDRPTIVWSH